jgi:hypothetical protein
MKMKTLPVHKIWMPLLVVVALMGTIGVAKLTGSWQTSGRGQVMLDESGVPDPQGIKGWMTLADVSETYEVPLDVLYALIGAGSDIPATTAMKDLEKLVPGTEVWAVREAVAAYQMGIIAPLH